MPAARMGRARTCQKEFFDVAGEVAERRIRTCTVGKSKLPDIRGSKLPASARLALIEESGNLGEFEERSLEQFGGTFLAGHCRAENTL